MENIKSIIESLIFVIGEPVSLDRLKRVLAPAATDEIRQALRELMAEYEERAGGFVLREVAGGYQFRTRPEYNQWIKLLLRPRTPRLSKAALETLAVIAYKQPIIRSDVEHIRGVDCGGVLRALLERSLIRVLGRKEIPGRPLIYGTTKHFLEVFDLKDLKDLPTPREIEELEDAADTELIEPGPIPADNPADTVNENQNIDETGKLLPGSRSAPADHATDAEWPEIAESDPGPPSMEGDYAAGQLMLSDEQDESTGALPLETTELSSVPDTRPSAPAAGEGMDEDARPRLRDTTKPNGSDLREEEPGPSKELIHKDLEEIDKGN